jgi:Prophage CP4-57 regulatory protein (AlpA)
MRTNIADNDPRLVLSFADLPALGITYSRAQLYRLIHANKFPQPIQLGPNRTVFRRKDIVDFIDNCERGVGTPVGKRGRSRRKAA